jgi:hypothetical protein
MYLWDTLHGVLHVYWVVLGTSNTLLIVYIKIIQPMVFTVWRNEGIEIILGFDKAMHYPFTCQKICYGV